MNVRVLGKGLELLSANGGRFEINQLLFADNTALVADSEEKLGKLVSEFGRVCEIKLRVYVGKSKVTMSIDSIRPFPYDAVDSNSIVKKTFSKAQNEY